MGCIFGVSCSVVLIYAVFLLPFLHRRLVQEDWTLKSWEVIKGPLLWRRGPVPAKPEGYNKEIVQDYYRGHAGEKYTSGAVEVIPPPPAGTNDVEKEVKKSQIEAGSDHTTSEPGNSQEPKGTPLENIDSPSGKWYTPRNLFVKAKYYFFRGVDRDVVAEQAESTTAITRFLAKGVSDMHTHTAHFDNKTEHLYSFLQVLTASVASFAHGSNDVSNAIGPLAAIYLIWESGTVASKSPVPVWVLVFGGFAIVVGLWTYGYHIMRNLGNRLTLHSPSRGFSMELGSAITVILATRLGLPISTTQCITGATVGVGLCSGTLRAINWRMVAWIYMGWIITLPIAGLIAGCLMGLIINAPRWTLVL